MSVLRIAIVTLGIYPIQIGGVEVLTYKQLEKLRKRGHKVFVITKKAPNDKRVEASDSYPVHRVGSMFPFVGQVLFLAAATFLLIRMRRSLDVVQVQYASYFTIPPFVLRLMSGVPYIVSCVGSDLLRWGRLGLWSRILRVLLLNASYVTALSTELRDVLVEEFRLPVGEVIVLPPPFDEAEVLATPRVPATSGKKVIFVGNLKPVKDPMTALRAFANLHRRMPDSMMVFVGDGPCRMEMEGFVTEQGLQANVAIRGSVAHEAALKEIADSDLLVMSSLSEGGPIAAMEAMALGVPVVGTNVGGLRDLVATGTSGLLVNPGAPEELAEAMYKVLASRTLAERFVAEASKRIAGRSWTNLVAHYEDLYARAVIQNRRRRPRRSGAGTRFHQIAAISIW